MSRGRKSSVFGILLTLVVLLFVGLGTVRIFLADSTENMPEGIQQIADFSADFLRRLGGSVHAVDENSETPWNLTLVNGDNPVPENWESELTQLRLGESVDSRMYPYLQEMFDACRADGLTPVVYSGYRTYETQERLFTNKIAAYEAEGNSEEEARRLASQWVARPGTSEHELGLAVDVKSENPEVCSNQQVYDWMAEHCQEYGFILRYSADTLDITGVQFEPWHFRYVGEEAAREIMSRGITLEEYLDNAKSD